MGTSQPCNDRYNKIDERLTAVMDKWYDKAACDRVVKQWNRIREGLAYALNSLLPAHTSYRSSLECSGLYTK